MNNEKPITAAVNAEHGKYYWVRPFERDSFEPAKCKIRADTLYFRFTDGGRMEVSRAWEYKPLVATNPLPPDEKIITDMCVTFNHSYGITKQNESDFGSGMTEEQQQALYAQMQQVLLNDIKRVYGY
jgi:hypothetical protein